MSRSATDPLELDAAAELVAAGPNKRPDSHRAVQRPLSPRGHRPVLALDDAAEQDAAERAAADLALDAAERTPPLELPAADDPERHRPVLAPDAAALGRDTAELLPMPLASIRLSPARTESSRPREHPHPYIYAARHGPAHGARRDCLSNSADPRILP